MGMDPTWIDAQVMLSFPLISLPSRPLQPGSRNPSCTSFSDALRSCSCDGKRAPRHLLETHMRMKENCSQ